MGLLIGIVNASNHTKYLSLCNQKCMTQPTLINLHSNEYSQEFPYYPFGVKLGRSIGSCNTLNYLSDKICVSNRTEDLNISKFNMNTGINESKTLTKHIPRECKCKLDGRKCNSDQWWNNDKCRCDCKKRHVCEKDYVWNPTTCSCENGKHLVSILDDSSITFDEIIESFDEDAEAKSYDETKNILTNFDEKA